VDIHSLIIPGTVRPNDEEDCGNTPNQVNISSVSTQYVLVNVSETLPPNISVTNPSIYTIKFAFLSGQGVPDTSTTWITGSWATSTSPYIAQILVGPNGTPLTIGTYRLWVRIDASPQQPVFSAGYINIY
jgi:hypothetical protein